MEKPVYEVRFKHSLHFREPNGLKPLGHILSLFDSKRKIANELTVHEVVKVRLIEAINRLVYHVPRLLANEIQLHYLPI